MDRQDAQILGTFLWPKFFPKDKFALQDKRVAAIQMFCEFLQNEGKRLIQDLDPTHEKSLYFDVSTVCQSLPFPDFMDTLRTRPNEVIGCLGCAISILKTREYSSNLSEPFCIWPRFQNFTDDCSFSDLKSGTVGQLVNIRGYVVRVSPCRPLIEGVCFLCGKCMKKTWQTFEDGVFNPPDECRTEKCRNKYLEFQRSNVIASDYQRIKIQELDTIEDTARVPRSFDIEVRGDLVNICIPGDVLRVVGIVRAMQNDAPRGGGGRGGVARESGIHQLYLVANSLQCVKASGDRDRDMGRARSSYNKAAAINNTSDNNSSSSSISSSSSNNNNGSSNNNNGSSNKNNNPTQRDPGTDPRTDPGTDPLTDPGTDEPQQPHIGLGRPSLVSFTPSELESVRKIALAEGPEGTLGLLVASLCPTIFGHELVKLGLLLALFGGTRTSNSKDGESSGGTHVRPDIHVLVVGDPGLGKSQLLRAAALVAPRSVFVCGNTTTAAGLTVSVSKEGRGGDVAIEAGALVLGDQGVCCIDELDNIACDHHALLEAMEQQSVSVAKSGVVTSLKSRTSVLAAANPSGGHYNRRKTVSENLKMAAALLSRFDLVFILLDKPDENHDRMISEHIMRTHALAGKSNNNNSNTQSTQSRPSTSNSQSQNKREDNMGSLSQRLRRAVSEYEDQSTIHTMNDSRTDELLSPENMRKYIEYARRYCNPRLSKAAAKVLQRLYLTMRAQSSLGNSIPVTTRHLESLIRLSQARARLELREEVTEDDAEDVVQLLHESLLDAFTTDSGEVDFGRKGGMSLAKQMKALVSTLNRESQLRGNQIFSRTDIAEICSRLRLDKEVDSLIDVMRTECYLLLKGPKLYQLLSV